MKYDDHTDDHMDDRIRALIVGYLTDSLEKNDLQRLKRWLNASESNKESFYRLKASWFLAGPSNEEENGAPGKIWEVLQKKIHSHSSSESRVSSKIHLLRYLRITASLLLFALIGSGITLLINRPLRTTTTEIVSPLGTRTFVKLPDASTVWLNAGSRLEYDNGYGYRNREVKLSGEGFFDIRSDPSAPFMVDAGGKLMVRALGTRFNVKAYPDESQITTTLVEGEVEVISGANTKKPYYCKLEPSQKVIYFTDEGILESAELQESISDEPDSKEVINISPRSVMVRSTDVETQRFTSWKDPRWIVHGIDMEDLARMLERRFNIMISIETDAIKDYHITGTFENETLEQVLDILKLTVPISYTLDKGLVTLTLDPELKRKYESAY